jgi:hypothetical protein
MNILYRKVANEWVETSKAQLTHGELYKEVLDVGAEVVGYWVAPHETNPINIEVLSVESALIVNSSMTHITCNELTDIVITGAVDVPDRMFALPVKRSDEKLTLFAVNVIDGKFRAVLNFPTSGQYRYTNEECNIDLPPNTFSVNPIKFDVLRKTGE